MKGMLKIIPLLIILSALVFAGGCSPASAADEGLYILDAEALASSLGKPGTVIVDMQKPEEYGKAHLTGAVNIPLQAIVINEPVPNMLAPKAQIEKVLGDNGISNDTAIIIYDNNKNMEAARLWWTLKIYGHDNAKVVSGGLEAIRAAKLQLTADKPSVSAVSYTAKEADTRWLADLDAVKQLSANPGGGTILLDTRSKEEFDAGTIPGAILYNFEENNFKDGTYKPVQHIKIQYYEAKIKPEQEIVMYCKTSVRAAQTFLALYNAGYRNLKVYDGAWLEWEASMKPAAPAAEAQPAAAQPAAEAQPTVAQPAQQTAPAEQPSATPAKATAQPAKQGESKPAAAPEPTPQPQPQPQPEPTLQPQPQPTSPPVESNNNDNS